MARNRETLALLAWEPYMHNPKLTHRLHRVGRRRPCSCAARATGSSPPIISSAMRALLPNARIETIAEAGHAPHARAARGLRRAGLAFLNGMNRPQKREQRHESLAFQRERLSLSAAGETSTNSIRVNLPNRNYDPHKGAALYDRYIDEWLIAEDEGMEIMLNEHHQTATCVDPAAPLVLGGLGARHHEGAAAHPRQSDRQSAAAGARRRGDGDDRCAVARPARGRLRARRALRGAAGQQQSRAHERAPLGGARPHRQGLDQP